jgi:hypothetical protein
MCAFSGISEQTAIISLYSVKWLVFITEEEREICGLLGYYAASYGNCLPTFRDNVSVPSSRVKSPSITTRRRIIPQKSADFINIATEARNQRSVFTLRYELRIKIQFMSILIFTLFSPVSIIPPLLHTELRLRVDLTTRTKGRSLRTFQRATFFLKPESTG